jgi:hypothetical protein
VLCLCPTGDPRTDGLAQARLLIDDGEADEVLVILVEQAGRDGAAGVTGSAVLATKGESG